MHLTGEDELLERDTLLAQRLREVHALAEGDVAVVVAVDEKHGGAPGLDGGHRRRVEGEARHVLAFRGVVGRLEIRDDVVPVALVE